MNAIKLYVSTARLILENDHHDFSVCKEIAYTFPSLEQSLTCTVCRNLLNEPYSPTETSCQHHVCKSCVGGRKKLRPSCSWCKDYTKYIHNSQLQCLLVCYKGLCDYIKSSNLLTQLTELFPTYTETDRSINSIVLKGIELPYGKEPSRIEPKTSVVSNLTDTGQNKNATFDSSLSPGKSNTHDSTFIDVGKIKLESHDDVGNDSPPASPISVNTENIPKLREISDKGNANYNDTVGDKTMYSVSFAGTRSKLILKRRPATTQREMRKVAVYESVNKDQLPVSNSVRSQQFSSQNSSNESRCRKSKSKPVVNSDRPNCRCGNATPRPGKLTCCGQRCACYMQSKACTGCRCRGCRNPHMFDGVKVLGRFMKEDQQDNNAVYPQLDPNFLNQQISYILPNDIPSGTVLNIS
ncbi:E3 ubiquitin-protein ligase MSL2 [Planococcus citri]|uniref:E3 ubiquitin-protein ligase MSL2 n=1 Tax=Planococcus citri TaxID=170843 RepID=UPI0031F99FC1